LKNRILHIRYLFFISANLKCILLLLCFGATGFAFAQDKSASEYQVKAIFLYNFTQFIDWPESAFKNSDDPFVIGIIGDDPFGSYLDEAVAGEKIGTHPIRVKRYIGLRTSYDCQMLYINSKDQEWVSNILSSVDGKNILTVGDAVSFNQLGGIIRFFNEESKIHFEINVARSKAARLTISSKLLSLAKTN